MLAFAKACNKVITNKGFRATIGSASLKWSCKKGKNCQGDWWEGTGITFRTIHYYAWMSTNGNEFDPFSTKPSDWGLSGEILVGESPSDTDGSLKHK